MPRMRVDLRPSTIRFDDGQDPIVNGIAQFGDTMAKLPVQLAQLRLKQADADEDKRRWEMTHQLSQDRLDQEGRIADDRNATAANKPGAAQKPMTGVVLNDVNDQVQGSALQQGYGTLDDDGGFSVNEQKRPEYQGARAAGFIRSGYNPDNYMPIGPENPYHVPMPKMGAGEQAPQAALPQMQQAPSQNFEFGSMGQDDQPGYLNTPAPAEPTQAQESQGPTEEDDHASSIAQLYSSGDIEGARSWIGQLRAERGNAFVEQVKQRVKMMRDAGAAGR